MGTIFNDFCRQIYVIVDSMNFLNQSRLMSELYESWQTMYNHAMPLYSPLEFCKCDICTTWFVKI